MTEYKYRWVRTALWNSETRELIDDTQHVQQMVSQGWERVPTDALPEPAPPPPTPVHGWFMPELLAMSQGAVGGLVLYRIASEKADAREKYFAEKTAVITKGVTEDFLSLPAAEIKYATKFAEVGIIDDDRDNRVLGADFYSPENLAAYPERQKELDDYHADVAVNGLQFSGLLNFVATRKP